MWRAGTWPAGRVAGIFEEVIAAIPAVVDKCACRVAVTEDHRVVVPDLLRRRQLAARILEPRLQPRERLRDGSIGNQTSFRVVRLEELASRRAVDDCFELPRQVVRVLDAGIAAEPAGRRHDMRTVTDEQDAPFLVAVGHGRSRFPWTDVHNVDLQISSPGPATNQVSAMFRREVFDALAAVRHELHGHQPSPVAAWHERPVDIRHEHRSDRAIIDDARQIGLENDVHPVLQDPGTVPADAYRLPDGAVRTIRADQIPGANTALRTGRSIANPRGDLVTRPREAHQLRVEAHVGAMPLGLGTQDRFELILIA